MKRLSQGRTVWVCMILIVLLASAEANKKDYYRILGLTRKATEKDIKKAYKKLSRKFHPDVVPEKDKAEAQKKFVEIAEAYQTLKDPKKKQVYDQGGHDAVRDFEQNQNNPGGGFHGGGFPGGGNFHFSSGGPGGFDFSNLFGSFFGGGGGGGGDRRQRKKGTGGGFGGFQGHDQYGDFGDMGFGGQEKPSKPFKDSDVLLIDKDSLYEIDNRRRLILSVYYTNDALQADEFETIKKFATKYKGIFNVVAIDCKKQKDICSNHRVGSVPTFKIYPEDKSKPPSDFKGKITVPNLEQQTIPKLENYVQKVGSRTVQSFMDQALKESKQIFIIYPTKQSTSPLFMSLSSLFKDRLILLEENLDDRLKGKLAAAERPGVAWLKNIHNQEVEAYTGKIERTSLSLWLQDRASRKMASATKTIIELNAQVAKSQCDAADPSFCVVGVFKTAEEKNRIMRLFEPALAKYKDDPVKFYIVNGNSLKTGCPSSDLPSVGVYRTKRNRLEPAGDNPSADLIYSKIDHVLSGAPLSAKMDKPWVSCF